MSQALSLGERIEIRGFGSFSLHYRPPRMGRNPKTGDAVALPGKHVPHFKPGKELRERVNLDLEKSASERFPMIDTEAGGASRSCLLFRCRMRRRGNAAGCSGKRRCFACAIRINQVKFAHALACHHHPGHLRRCRHRVRRAERRHGRLRLRFAQMQLPKGAALAGGAGGRLAARRADRMAGIAALAVAPAISRGPRSRRSSHESRCMC